MPARWRGARVDDRGGLENRCSPCGYRGFESLPLRWIVLGDDSELNPVGAGKFSYLSFWQDENIIL